MTDLPVLSQRSISFPYIHTIIRTEAVWLNSIRLNILQIALAVRNLFMVWYAHEFLIFFQGKPTSRLRPEFVIFDPQLQNDAKSVKQNAAKKSERKFLLSPAIHRKFRNHSRNRLTDNSDSETDDSCVSTPRMQRRKLRQSTKTQPPLQRSELATNKGANVPPSVLPEVNLIK